MKNMKKNMKKCLKTEWNSFINKMNMLTIYKIMLFIACLEGF